MVWLALLACAIRASGEAKYTAVQCYPGVGNQSNPSATYSESSRNGREAFCDGDGLGIYLPSRGANGHFGQWTISAPEGTRFSYISLFNRRGAAEGWRPRTVAIGTDGSPSYIKGWRDGAWHAGSVLGSFEAVASKLVCRPFSTGGLARRGRAHPRCRPSWAAYVFARQFKFVIGDATPPVVSGLQGPLFSAGNKSGIQAGAFTVSDRGGGVQQVFLRVNGTRTATRNYVCQLTKLDGVQVADELTPCPARRIELLAVNTSAAPFRSGANSVQVCATDYTVADDSRFPANVACAAPRTVNVSSSGSNPGGTPGPRPEPEPQPPPPPPSPPPPSRPPSGGACPLSQTGAHLQMSMAGCRLVASDTASRIEPRPFWGSIDCAQSSRAQNIASGGDIHLTASGTSQGASAYRRLTVLDGDDYSGERCELGYNDHRAGPTAFYREGQRRATFFSLRLPSNFPLNADTWQTVMQMKQAQPSHDDGSVPILFMGAYLGLWHIESENAANGYWTFPARSGIWTRFAFDVYYSKHPSRGWLQVSADLNNDGDFNDAGERSPVIHAATLQTEIAGPWVSSDGLAPGDPIPSHLRTGVYHNPSIPCPAPAGCSIEVDNVQVLKSPTGP